jgi:hypothetical protein
MILLLLIVSYSLFKVILTFIYKFFLFNKTLYIKFSKHQKRGKYTVNIRLFGWK